MRLTSVENLESVSQILSAGFVFLFLVSVAVDKLAAR